MAGDDNDDNDKYGAAGGIQIRRGELIYSKMTSPNAPLSTTNST
jgi:hypothetical protein